MRLGVPGSFTLDVRNTGTGTAWNVVLSDILPNVTTAPTGGMCATAPTNIAARVYQADGVTPVSANLVNGTDFTVGFAGAPSCTLTISLQGSRGGDRADAAPDRHLQRLARCRHEQRHHAHQRRRRHAVAQRQPGRRRHVGPHPHLRRTR